MLELDLERSAATVQEKGAEVEESRQESGILRMEVARQADEVLLLTQEVQDHRDKGYDNLNLQNTNENLLMNMVLLMAEVENQRNLLSEEKTRSSQMLQEKMQQAQTQA